MQLFDFLSFGMFDYFFADAEKNHNKQMKNQPVSIYA